MNNSGNNSYQANDAEEDRRVCRLDGEERDHSPVKEGGPRLLSKESCQRNRG